MRHRMKLVTAGAILLLGVGGATLFRREAAPETLAGQPATLPLRALQTSPAAGANGPVEARIKPLSFDGTLAAESPPAERPSPPVQPLPRTIPNGSSVKSPVQSRQSARPSPAMSEPISVEHGSPGPDERDIPANTEPAAVTLHKIRDGDSLPLIAERYLGDAGRAEEIYQVNRDVLASPDLLPIGVELRIFTPSEE